MLALELDVVVKRDGLGPDVALLEIGMDHTCRLWSGVADMDGPGAHFLDACGEIRLQAEQLVCCSDQPVQSGFSLAEFFQEHLPVFIAHVGHLGL